MANYHTYNFEKEWHHDLQTFLEEHPQYTSTKQFIKEAVNEKREKIIEQEMRRKELEKD